MQNNYSGRKHISNENIQVKGIIDKITALRFGLGEEFIEFKHVLGPFPAPVLITSADVQIVYVNPAWEQLTGYTFKEVEGENPRILKSDKTDKNVFLRLWKALKKGESFTTESIIDKRKDGSEFHINSIIFPINHDDKTLFYVQLELDITNRKRLEDLKQEFLSTATHELKTPITTLKLLIQSQLRKMMNKEFTKIKVSELQLVDRELNRLTRIVEDLSDVSRIEAGKLRMNVKTVNIVSVIRDAVHQMKTIAHHHSIIIKSAAPVYVIADEDRIKQVLINLIKNALKYSYPESEIVISSTVENNRCIVSIQNAGLGIPKHKQPYLFDRFYQLHKGSNGGLGLGLYISKKIIEGHKGKLWVESKKCKLTKFSFSLSIVQSKER